MEAHRRKTENFGREMKNVYPSLREPKAKKEMKRAKREQRKGYSDVARPFAALTMERSIAIWRCLRGLLPGDDAVSQ
jgi:hypothetical protein